MPTLSYSEIKPKKYIVWNNEPYEVLEARVFRKQQMKPQNATKLRHLITGKVIENSFHQNEKVLEAEIETTEAKFLYTHRGEYWFCPPDNPKERFQIPADKLGVKARFIKADSEIGLIYFNQELIGVDIPIKVNLKVIAAPPAVKGNTASGANKQITLETGTIINAPMFINENDIVRVNTETGEYTERVTL